MKLPYDIYGEVPPIAIGKGDQAFALKVRRASSTQRMAIIDAIGANSYAAAWQVTMEMVAGWEGLLNADGSPIPVEGIDVQTQQPVRNVGRVLAALPLAWQVEVFAALMAFAGLPAESLQPMIDALNAATGASVDLRPTSTPPTPSGGGASAS